MILLVIQELIDSSQSIVRVQENKPGKAKAPQPRQNRNDHLPDECHDDDTWSSNVVRLMLLWASCHRNPWSINDRETAHALAIICAEFYAPEIVTMMSLDDLDCPAIQIVSLFFILFTNIAHAEWCIIVDESALHRSFSKNLWIPCDHCPQ